MAQILDPLPSDKKDKIICCYVNATSQIQIARITNIPNWYFERVIFPGQRLVFEALPAALLEIHTGMMASAILSDTIPCVRLCVEENGPSSKKLVPEQVAQTSNPRQNLESVSRKTPITTENLNLAVVG
ncbi:MAG: DUF1830 domain-containing protein [Symploca sp. SIO2C1]|nr:DUF1830 domain-containing protein [Symploca sp. SIO2C1]